MFRYQDLVRYWTSVTEATSPRRGAKNNRPRMIQRRSSGGEMSTPSCPDDVQGATALVHKLTMEDNSENNLFLITSDLQLKTCGSMSGTKHQDVDRDQEIPGPYEVETVMYEAGTDLKGVPCRKSSRHKNFIPIDSFTVDHFPSEYQQPWRVDMVKAMGELTVHLKVGKVGFDRPKHFPFHKDAGGSKSRFGSGYVGWVFKCGEGGVGKVDQTCECESCLTSQNPRKTWWEFGVVTAAHVVCGKDEVEDTTVTFFKDTKSSVTVSAKVERKMFVGSSVEDDRCSFSVIVHNDEVGERLERAWERCMELRYRVCDEDPVIIVSHPHGLEKFVTVGKEVVREKHPVDVLGRPCVTYTCDTCPGSSGAGVMCCYSELDCGRVQHSRAWKDGKNKSGHGWYV